LPKLRLSVIHNDPNDYNVLVDGEFTRVVGLIDFGDMVHSYTIADLAVAIAYVLLGKTDPVAAARNVVAGYFAEQPLNESEIEAVFGLALMRLCMSVCLAAYQQQQQPDNEYLEISQRAIAESLPGLVSIAPGTVASAFRQVLG